MDKLVSTPPSSKADDESGSQSAQKRVSASNVGTASKPEEAEPQTKRPKTEESPKDSTSELDERLNKPVEELVKDDPMAAEKKAARERARVPLEVRMAQFSQMLVENEVIFIYFFINSRLGDLC